MKFSWAKQKLLYLGRGNPKTQAGWSMDGKQPGEDLEQG